MASDKDPSACRHEAASSGWRLGAKTAPEDISESGARAPEGFPEAERLDPHRFPCQIILSPICPLQTGASGLWEGASLEG